MISVILPTYNREAVLMRSVDSVLNQTVSDLELILVDDGSTDGTQTLIESIQDPRIRYLKLDGNHGACAARNAGLDAARGEWIAFMDSDDAWTPNKLERMMCVMEQTGADVCFHRLVRHYPGKQADKLFPELSGSRFIPREELLCYAMISTQTIVAKREVFTKHRFDPKVRKSQDYDWAIRATKDYRLYYADEVLADQYYQSDSLSLQGIRVIAETRQYFLEKYAEDAQAYPPFALYQLKIIAKNKTLLGEDATPEFRRIAEIEGGAANRIKLVLSRLGILRVLYRIRGDHKQELP